MVGRTQRLRSEGLSRGGRRRGGARLGVPIPAAEYPQSHSAVATQVSVATVVVRSAEYSDAGDEMVTVSFT